MVRKKRWSSAAVVVTLVALTAGTACGRGQQRSDEAAPKAAGAGVSAGAERGVAAAGSAVGSAPDVAAGPASPVLGAPRVVKTATISLRLAKGRFRSSFSRVATIAEAKGGFVASSTSRAGERGGRNLVAGTVVVRVPGDRFDEARRELGGLGRLTAEDLRGEDVGGRLTDLEARLRNLRSQEEAMRALMAKAANVGETIQVQQQLGAVREQIEQLSAEQARLSDAVSLATITVALSEPGVAVAEPRASRLEQSLRDAANGAQAVLAGAIVTLGYLLPLGALAVLAWLLARSALRYRRPTTRPLPPEPVSSM